MYLTLCTTSIFEKRENINICFMTRQMQKLIVVPEIMIRPPPCPTLCQNIPPKSFCFSEFPE